MSRFDFYYGTEADQFSFYRIPKELFTNEYFATLSTDAKVLYGLMIDRMSLSRKNCWLDSSNRVYIIFTQAEAMDMLHCSKNKIVDFFAELDKFGLILRKKQGQGKPTIIYVYNIYNETQEVATVDDFTYEKNHTGNFTGEDYDFQTSQNGKSRDLRIGSQEVVKQEVKTS